MMRGLKSLVQNTPPLAITPKIMSGNEVMHSYLSEELDSEEVESPDNPVPPKITQPNESYCPVYMKSQSEAGGRCFECFITSSIEGIPEYFGLLEVLGMMVEGDEIDIYIASPGGLICSGSAISSMITECKGVVNTIATGICASAGSLIWSAGHNPKVEPTAVLMWHMSAHFASGNSKTIQIEAQRMVDHVKNVFLTASVEKGHITAEEMEIICKEPNREIWISAEEMSKRLAAHKATTETPVATESEE